MNWNLRVLTVLGFGAALALSGCGDDDDNGIGLNMGGNDVGNNGDNGNNGNNGNAGNNGGNGGPATCEVPAEPPCDGEVDLQPPRTNEHAAAYVPERLEMVVFGGNTAVPVNCGRPDWEFNADTWIFYDYDNSCGRWAKLSVAGPPARGRHSAIYGDGAVWVFGGRFRSTGTSGNYQLFNDLWRFDVNSRVWEQVEAQGNPPAARYNTALVHDSKRNLLWVFGGNDSPSGALFHTLNDVWRFNIATSTWEEVATTGDIPSTRLWHDALYDATRDRIVTYGGGDETAFNNDARYFKDLSALDLETLTWSVVDAGGNGAPEGRFWSRIVHDQSADRYIMFGGHDDQTLGNRNDTWTYAPFGGVWNLIDEGDFFNAPQNAFCDFPPDFTVVDTAQPERRNAHTFVWSGPCGHGLIFGGKTDCGASNDVWRYEDGTWTEVVEATEGEVCHRFRSNPDNCVNLCF